MTQHSVSKWLWQPLPDIFKILGFSASGSQQDHQAPMLSLFLFIIIVIIFIIILESKLRGEVVNTKKLKVEEGKLSNNNSEKDQPYWEVSPPNP